MLRVLSSVLSHRLARPRPPENAAGSTIRRITISTLDPCRDVLATHVSVGPDGVVISKTAEGQILIDLCLLNRPALVSARLTMVRLLMLVSRCMMMRPRVSVPAVVMLARRVGMQDCWWRHRRPELDDQQHPAESASPSRLSC